MRLLLIGSFLVVAGHVRADEPADTRPVGLLTYAEGGTRQPVRTAADWAKRRAEILKNMEGIYFAFCFSMSRYSLWIEKRLSVSKNR